MPPRDYLQEGDMDLLFAYLLELAAVPEGKRQSTHEVSWARRGDWWSRGHATSVTTRWGAPSDAGAIARGCTLAGIRDEDEIVARVRAQGP